MPQETKTCQSCKKEFLIEPQDFAFYEKIKVPAPTWCPECRLVRRLSFKNESKLYKRNCDLCGQQIIAIYPKHKSFPVYCPKCWWSDKWDVIQYGQDYDFSKPFFEQLHYLIEKVPRIGLNVDYNRMINSDYANLTGPLKNCYLLFLAEDDENCLYSYSIFYSKDSIDCTKALKVENCYFLFNCQDCYNVFFSVDCNNCLNIYFSKNLRNCSECFGCVNLINKKYNIFNKQYSKEEYFNKLKEFHINSYKNILKIKKETQNFWLNFPNKYYHGTKNNNVSGDYIYNSRNVLNSFEVVGGENNRFCHVLNMKPTFNCYDFGDWGNKASFIYESVNCGENINNVKFCSGCWIGYNWDYCDVVCSCENVFGCSNIRNKQYCILNKQYTKEEYGKLVPKIIKHMDDMPYTDKKGRVYKYGEFFPSELSPFSYNETIAQEYFPLTKEQALEQGYTWKDPEQRDLTIDIKTDELPDNIKDIKDDIVGKVIECQHQGKCNEQCTEAFKIITQELEFYRKMNLPLPRLCPNCRHYQRIKQRNPLKLWRRKCQCAGEKSENGAYQNTIEHFHAKDHCPNEFETTYSSDRPEIIYCEECYKREVN